MPRRLLPALLDLVLPAHCAGCEALGAEVCAQCLGELLAQPLGRHAPTPCPAGLPPLAVARSYDGVAQSLLLAHKERARLRLVAPLGQALAGALAVLGPPRGCVVVPVPSSRAAVRQRGHDHARRLAAGAAHEARLRVVPLLVPARAVADQSGLATAARAANLQGALRARGRLDSLQVVVVDDVVTTGATLVEAARALSAAGAEVVGAACVAGTQRRRVARTEQST